MRRDYGNSDWPINCLHIFFVLLVVMSVLSVPSNLFVDGLGLTRQRLLSINILVFVYLVS